MIEYRPRNKNPRIDTDNRNSWSTAFDRHVGRKQEHRHPCGFRVEDKT